MRHYQVLGPYLYEMTCLENVCSLQTRNYSMTINDTSVGFNMIVNMK